MQQATPNHVYQLQPKMSRRQRSDAQSTSGLEGVSRGVNVGVSECINDWKKFQLALEKGMKSCESVAEDLLVSIHVVV